MLIGEFNPAIITPWWLVHVGFLSADDAQQLTEVTTLPRLSIFQAAWLRCDARDDGLFQFSTSQSLEYDRLRDLVLGVLRTLPHVPLGAMGLNRDFHFQSSSPDVWHSIGDRLIPKKFWQSHLKLPRGRSLQLRVSETMSMRVTYVLRIEPSNVVPIGVFVEYNDHYVFARMCGEPRLVTTSLTPNLQSNLLGFREASSENISHAVNVLTETGSTLAMPLIGLPEQLLGDDVRVDSGLASTQDEWFESVSTLAGQIAGTIVGIRPLSFDWTLGRTGHVTLIQTDLTTGGQDPSMGYLLRSSGPHMLWSWKQ